MEKGIPHKGILKESWSSNSHIRQILRPVKWETDSDTTIVGDFNTPLAPTGRSSRQKIYMETQALNDTLDQTDLIFMEHSI